MNEQTGKKRIGLYGGSFNPPHYGHFIAAYFAYHVLGLDEVWMMVTPGNPTKEHDNPDVYAPFDLRLKWCGMLAKTFEKWLKPSGIEKKLGTTQTADTMRKIAERYPDCEFVWIMGADNLVNFHTWNRWQEILDNYAIAVIARSADGESETDKEKAEQEREKALHSPAALYAAHLQLAKPEDLKGRRNGWCFLETQSFNIKSSAIVKSLQAGMRGIRDLWPGIEESILEEGAYGLKKEPTPAPPPVKVSGPSP